MPAYSINTRPSQLMHGDVVRFKILDPRGEFVEIEYNVPIQHNHLRLVSISTEPIRSKYPTSRGCQNDVIFKLIGIKSPRRFYEETMGGAPDGGVWPQVYDTNRLTEFVNIVLDAAKAHNDGSVYVAKGVNPQLVPLASNKSEVW